MGDPKKQKKKYTPPRHPWEKERIEKERGLVKEYGFKNKREIWKMNFIINNVKDQAKKLTALDTSQAEIEKKGLINRLFNLGIIPNTAKMEDVLDLDIKDVCDRRLQTVVFKKELARSVNQARQFIIHGHVKIGDKKVSAPSYLVLRDEESQISFAPNSALFSEEHPERVVKEELPKKSKTEPIEKIEQEEMPQEIKTEQENEQEVAE